MKILLASLFCLGLLAATVSAADNDKSTPEALAFKMNSLDGKPVDLSSYKGKVLLVVNVASRCGLTPQYKDLQAMYEKYNDEGFEILAFPCNQFGRQEPGSADEIASFCEKNYSVSFDMFEKVGVNGDEACDLYKYLTALDVKPKGAGKVSWNFEKFLIDRSGKVVARFSPPTKPTDAEIIKEIKKALAAK